VADLLDLCEILSLETERVEGGATAPEVESEEAEG
jgi:hypothetical protein